MYDYFIVLDKHISLKLKQQGISVRTFQAEILKKKRTSRLGEKKEFL